MSVATETMPQTEETTTGSLEPAKQALVADEKQKKDEAECATADEAENNLQTEKKLLTKNQQKDDRMCKMNARLRRFLTRQRKTIKLEKTNDAKAKTADLKDSAETLESEQEPAQKRSLMQVLKGQRKRDDVELGLSKAGLASIETLDDSFKEHDIIDGVPAKNKIMPKNAKKTNKQNANEAEEQKNCTDVETISYWQQLRSYSCSVDDVLILLGLLLFLLLVTVIGYVLSHESLTSAPLRAGRYIDAVTSCGMVEGVKEDGAFAFRRIPYALAPVAERRWQRAQLIENIDDCWKNKLQTHNASEVLCLQLQTNALNGTQLVGAEDCLYLDVVTPHVRYDRLLPVVVLIGADSYTGPSPGILRPSARYARSHDVVFVRPNFRLGALGFLSLKALSERAYPHTSGNYALTDILAALQWVQLNIKNFGGDPNVVTLLGHRAGATLVTALVTSQQAKSLYARAWVSSPSSLFPGKPLSHSEERNQNIMHELNCADVDCLLNATAEQIWAATPDSWLHSVEGLPSVDENTSAQQHEWLTLDGQILQRHPADYWKEQAAQMLDTPPKFVMGTTAHEMHTNKLRNLHANWTAEHVHAFIAASKLGQLNLTEEALQRYNCTDYNQLVSMITDIRSVCPLLINARIQPSVMFYLVVQGDTHDQLAMVGADVLAILGRYEPHTVEERRFVSSMQQLFYYYVSHGRIPLYDPRRRVVTIGQDPFPTEDHKNCNFWIRNDIVPRFARH